MLVAVIVLLLGCLLAGALADTAVRIMPLGDSITRGMKSTDTNGYRKSLYLNLTSSNYNVDFVGSQTDGVFADPNHEGHDGWHANQIRDDVYNWLVDNPADVVLLHIGTNDISYGDEDVNEVNDILEEIDRYSEDITVILARIIKRNDSKNPETIAFNNAVVAMANGRIASGDDIVVVDMENALDYPDDLYDTVHPNDSGYAKMANVWYAALDDLLGVAPMIISTPVEDVTVGHLYSYDVDANGYPEPTYALIAHPNGMTIDPNTGLIQWIPSAGGDFYVDVMASNGHLPDANQGFTVTVSTIIAFDASSEASSGLNGKTLSWQHAIGDGEGRILVVGIVGKDGQANDLMTSGVTYNDVNMNPVEGSSELAGSYVKTELYYLLESNLPSPGSYMVEVSYFGNVSERCGGAISLFNVDQQGAEAVDTNSNEGMDSISTNISTVTDEAWVVDVVGCDNNNGLFSTATGGMVERFETSSDSSTAAGGTEVVDIAGMATMSWSYSSGANQLVQSAAAFAPARRTISGHILDTYDVPVDSVVVEANNGVDSDTSDPNGYYEVEVPYGWSGTVKPTKAGYMFNPSERAYSDVITHQLSQDYEDVSIYDVDLNGFIGWGDVGVIGENWLDDTGGNICDFDTDGYVNLKDFAKFAAVW